VAWLSDFLDANVQKGAVDLRWGEEPSPGGKGPPAVLDQPAAGIGRGDALVLQVTERSKQLAGKGNGG
jgi:hypothetical protein